MKLWIKRKVHVFKIWLGVQKWKFEQWRGR